MVTRNIVSHQDTLRFALLCDPCSCQHQLNRRTPQIFPIFKHSALQLFSSLPSSLFPLVPLSPTKLDQNDPSHSCSWPTSQPSNHRSPEMMRSFNRSDRVPWTTASDRSNLVQVRPCTHLNVRVNLLQLGWIDHRKLLATHCLYLFFYDATIKRWLEWRHGWDQKQ